MKIKKTLLSMTLSGAMVLGLMPGITMTALATELPATTSYTLVIPSTLTVADKGWNATDGISATGTLVDGKKLTVTASSGDEFALVNQSDNTQKVGYKLAAASTDTEAATSWEFTELSGTATTKPMGIIVDDYSTKPAGTYTDTVTFTASVKSAATILTSTHTVWADGETYVAANNVTINSVTVNGNVTLILNDGVTLTINNGLNTSGTLTIQGQSAGTGKMNVSGKSGIIDSDRNAIYGSGKIVVAGGTVTASGGSGNSTYNRNGGDGISAALEISGGSVMANGGNGANGSTGGSYSYGINGTNGGNGISGATTVTGGKVQATGGKGGSAGSYTTTMYNDSPYTQNGSAGSDGKGMSGALTAEGLSVQGSTDNGTWTDASTNYGTYRYVKIGEDS